MKRSVLRDLLTIGLFAFLTGCSYDIQMMSRDGGAIYTGSAEGNGFGKGIMTVTIKGTTYTGTIVKTASSDTFGFMQQYGGGTKPVFGSYQSYGGSSYFKALLSSPDGHGLRCDITGNGSGHGGGICVDDNKKIYDVIGTRS